VAVTAGLPPGAEAVGEGGRSTPVRLAAWTAAVGVSIAALLGVTVGAFTAADSGTTSIARRAAVASDSADLYFNLSDLDAEAARLVLLGGGTAPVPGGQDHQGDQISTLAAYNERTSQVDVDLRRLAASADGRDGSAVAALSSGVTTYHQIADAAVALDQTAPNAQSANTGAPAGLPTPDAIGYYSRASALIQGQLLPTALKLRDDKARALADAASSAHLAGLVGAGAAAGFGLAAVIVTFSAQGRLRRWFRRVANPGVAAAAVLTAALALGSLSALTATARDGSAAGSRFADYLAVTRVRAASYDVDGAVTRYLLIPDTTLTPVHSALSYANKQLDELGAPGGLAQKRWKTVANNDVPAITGPVTDSSSPEAIAAALSRDTGTARGQESFDFFYYDAALLTLSNDRLAAFDSSMSTAQNDLSGWTWLPWALAAAALLCLGAGVRPRFGEYR
jgi:hypothetical protein